ncbi:hypothetical protein J2Y65_000120 [Aeromonas salmonicida]|uniref:DUF6602 domain-containing protein n=1 Tax=Aeromonas salmonicida TaxID=645 RepID=UPI0028619DAA|nr:DUF6602 domain-containing protein [Aeromonas salmonicida]MDR6993496.1 hypothetical protein [Aeromonas salmonicida]
MNIVSGNVGSEPELNVGAKDESARYIEIFEKMMDEEFKSSIHFSKVNLMLSALDPARDRFSAKYKFLQSVVNNDSGTAGKECEQLFIDFLTEYLPKNLEVCSGGRILLENGDESPQIDIIVIKDMPKPFPRTYISHEYVVAAFEVKLTLKKEYLKKIANTAALLRPCPRYGTPRSVLFGKIIYGVLSLSSNMSGKKIPTEHKNLMSNWKESDSMLKALRELGNPRHPSQAVDLVLVADSFFLGASKDINYSKNWPVDFLDDIELYYYNNFSVGAGKENASMLARTLAIPPRDQVLGAFLSRLFYMLFREGIVDSDSAEAMYPFESSFKSYCYSWNIDVLGEEFKSQWENKSTSGEPEWRATHP